MQLHASDSTATHQSRTGIFLELWSVSENPVISLNYNAIQVTFWQLTSKSFLTGHKSSFNCQSMQNHFIKKKIPAFIDSSINEKHWCTLGHLLIFFNSLYLLFQIPNSKFWSSKSKQRINITKSITNLCNCFTINDLEQH